MRLATLLDREAVGERCRGALAGHVERWLAVGRRLRRLGYDPESAVRAFFVPGRIELVGKHTDYAGGRSLVAATEQGFHLVVAARRDGELRLDDVGRGERASLDLAGDLDSRPGHWTSYPLAVARRARRDFALELGGADVAFVSTLPAAAGMSSSSALIVATWLALAAVDPLEATASYRREIETRERLAEYLAAVEAGRAFGRLAASAGVGTAGGSEDHTAILCSRPGCLSLYAYAPPRRQRTIELPGGWLFAVAVSGVRAEKSAGARDAYNRASLSASELAARWRRETGGREPHLAAILARGPAARDELARLAAAPGGAFAPGELGRRLEHFVAENELVAAAAEALAAGDLAAVGRLADRSQRLAGKLLGNQTHETMELAAGARSLGAVAASAFGAGFGGAVWALVERDRAAAFLGRWRQRYLRDFPQHRSAAAFLTTRPGPPACEL